MPIAIYTIFYFYSFLFPVNCGKRFALLVQLFAKNKGPVDASAIPSPFGGIYLVR